MLPLILGASLVQGGIGALTGGLQADAERKKIRQRNAQLDSAKSRIEEERNKLRSDTQSLSQDFMTNYITVRDPNKAEGIRQSYGSNISNYRSADAQLGSQIASLEAQKEGEGMSSTNAALMGLGIGAAQGAASGIGAGLGSGESLSNMFSWSGASSGLNTTNNIIPSSSITAMDKGFQLNNGSFSTNENLNQLSNVGEVLYNPKNKRFKLNNY